jgi:hypothetical protein
MTNKALLALLLLATGCQTSDKPTAPAAPTAPRPIIQEQGRRIAYPAGTPTLRFFHTEAISPRPLSADYQAPAYVVATVVAAPRGERPLVLFANPDLTSNFTQLQQHLTNIRQIQGVNIKQKQTELARAHDLAAHGAATGRDVLEARTALAMEQTNLANERSLMAEHEAQLQLAGFEPDELQRARPGQAWLICDVPESQINKLRVGHTCTVQFTAYPDETINGRIESFGDVVDNTTRTIKLRIGLPNPRGKFRAGMFATVAFGVSEGQFMAVPQTALITVQGKDYVFVADSNRFERRPVTLGQQIGDRIIVFNGLRSGEKVVTKGTIQLKGLSFGY